MKVVVAPDSFKGSLSAEQVSHAMAEGVKAADGSAEVTTIPMADGGEGTIDALEKWTSREISVSVRSPAGKKITTSS